MFVSCSPIASEQEAFARPSSKMVTATGLLEETIDPAKEVAAVVLTSRALYVCPAFNTTEKDVFAACPVIAVRGVTRTVVLSCVATMSMDEKEAGVDVELAQYF